MSEFDNDSSDRIGPFGKDATHGGCNGPVNMHTPMDNPHRDIINIGHASMTKYPFVSTSKPALGKVKHHKKKSN